MRVNDVRGFFLFGGVLFWYGCPIRRVIGKAAERISGKWMLVDECFETPREIPLQFYIIIKSNFPSSSSNFIRAILDKLSNYAPTKYQSRWSIQIIRITFNCVDNSSQLTCNNNYFSNYSFHAIPSCFLTCNRISCTIHVTTTSFAISSKWLVIASASTCIGSAHYIRLPHELNKLPLP